MRLAPERQHFMNLIKMVAYQAESDLIALIQPHYPRAAHEGRTLIQSALAGTADLTVTESELRVRLHPLGSPHRTRAITALYEELNRLPRPSSSQDPVCASTSPPQPRPNNKSGHLDGGLCQEV